MTDTDRKTWGWCPSVWRPMPLDDGLLVRLRPHLGRLTKHQALGVCDLAARCGSGQLELTNRGSMQLRGVTPDTHPDLLAGMQYLGLLDPDLATETRRSLQATPHWHQGDLTARLADAFLTRLDDLPELPAKFGYVLDCGPAPCLGDVPGDIRIERSADGLIVRADGAATGRAVTEETVWDAAIELGQWVTAHLTPERRRMAHVTAHLAPPARLGGTAPLPPATAPQGWAKITADTDTGAISSIALARAIEESGATALRLTPWRKLLLEETANSAQTPETTA